MKSVKTIMIVGLGSMGSRRIRLLKKLRPEIRLCGVDMNVERRIKTEADFGIRAYEEIALAIQVERPEAVVISTSPLTHSHIIHECLCAGLHVFTELNLVADGYLENMALAKGKSLVLFLSSTFLYREETCYLIDRVKKYNRPLSYRYHVGQYLPDWHPWESYRDYFIGDMRTNGCRELFAIELPWLCAAFGPIEDAKLFRQRCTELQISYDDSYMLLLRHQNGCVGNLCVDVVSRKAVRQFEAYGEELYLSWGGQPNALFEWDVTEKIDVPIQLYQKVEHKEGYAGFVIENAYAEELTAFLNQVEHGTPVNYGFAEDLETLRWIDRLEQMGVDGSC